MGRGIGTVSGEERATGATSDGLTAVLEIRIDPELHARLREKARDFGTDLSADVRWCLRMGLCLSALVDYVRANTSEPLPGPGTHPPAETFV